MNNNDQIVISKSKLLKGIGITVGIILLLVICFFASTTNTEKYSEADSSSNLSDEELYEVAVKNASEVSDEERVSPHEISVDEYVDLYKSDKKSLVLFSRPTCQYCQIATPILENIIYKYKVEINYINTDELSDDDNASLVSSDEYFSEGYGTPLLLVVGNGEIIDKIEGLTTKDNYISFFKEYEFME